MSSGAWWCRPPTGHTAPLAHVSSCCLQVAPSYRSHCSLVCQVLLSSTLLACVAAGTVDVHCMLCLPQRGTVPLLLFISPGKSGAIHFCVAFILSPDTLMCWAWLVPRLPVFFLQGTRHWRPHCQKAPGARCARERGPRWPASLPANHWEKASLVWHANASIAIPPPSLCRPALAAPRIALSFLTDPPLYVMLFCRVRFYERLGFQEVSRIPVCFGSKAEQQLASPPSSSCKRTAVPLHPLGAY